MTTGDCGEQPENTNGLLISKRQTSVTSRLRLYRRGDSNLPSGPEAGEQVGVLRAIGHTSVSWYAQSSTPPAAKSWGAASRLHLPRRPRHGYREAEPAGCGCGQGTRKRRIEDTRGRVHAIAVRVYAGRGSS
jgi:hypothetical protein